MIRTITKRTVNELKPNDVIRLFEGWFRVRYLRYQNGSTSVDLQREADELSPFHDSTCIVFTILPDTDAWIEVEVKQ